MEVTGGLETDVTLDDPGQVGDSLSIELAEDPRSTSSWRVAVDVQTDQGRFSLGRFATIPPSPAGFPSARVVATATVPGAAQWFVRVFSAQSADHVDVRLKSSRCCAGPTGLYVVDPATGRTDLHTGTGLFDHPGAMLSARVVKAGPGRFGRLRGFGFNPAIQPAVVAFVQRFDLAALPAPGAVPLDVAPMVFAGGIPEAPRFELDVRAPFEFHAVGIVWAASLTPAIYTPVVLPPGAGAWVVTEYS